MIRTNWAASFDSFDKANPSFYLEFKRRAVRHRAAGVGYITAALIFEEMRCYAKARTTTDLAMPDHLRNIQVNNNYRAACVRRLISEDSSFAPFFKMRELKVGFQLEQEQAA